MEVPRPGLRDPSDAPPPRQPSIARTCDRGQSPRPRRVRAGSHEPRQRSHHQTATHSQIATHHCSSDLPRSSCRPAALSVCRAFCAESIWKIVLRVGWRAMKKSPKSTVAARASRAPRVPAIGEWFRSQSPYPGRPRPEQRPRSSPIGRCPGGSGARHSYRCAAHRRFRPQAAPLPRKSVGCRDREWERSESRARWPLMKPIHRSGRVPIPRRAPRATRQCRCRPHAKLASRRRAILRPAAERQSQVAPDRAPRSRRPSLPSTLFSHLARYHLAWKRVHANSSLAQHHDPVMAVEHSTIRSRLERARPPQRERVDQLARRESTKLVEFHPAEADLGMERSKWWLCQVCPPPNLGHTSNVKSAFRASAGEDRTR
jgi:hypothetical protein